MSRSSLLIAHRTVRFNLSPSFLSTARHLPRNFSSSAASSSSQDASEGDAADLDQRRVKFPDLMQPDVLYDSAHSRIYRGRRSRRLMKINVRNDPPFIAVDEELNASISESQSPSPSSTATKARKEGKEEEEEAGNNVNEEKNSWTMVHDFKGSVVHQYGLVSRRITQQTGKGKIHRPYLLIVVGNGDGLVGYGEGKHEEYAGARRKAIIEAIRNMDAVERFEQRTIWTDMSIKLGSTRVLMRPRPVGFGLHCNPNIHQVLKAAGIKDVSAKVWGSRNPINVIKATCMLIQAGSAPLSMGNGIGGKGKRLDAGVGMRGKESIERDRGRKLADGRTW